MRKNPHPMPVQREARRKAAQADKEREQEYYRDHDPRREGLSSHGGGTRIAPVIEDE